MAKPGSTEDQKTRKRRYKEYRSMSAYLNDLTDKEMADIRAARIAEGGYDKDGGAKEAQAKYDAHMASKKGAQAPQSTDGESAPGLPAHILKKGVPAPKSDAATLYSRGTMGSARPASSGVAPYSRANPGIAVPRAAPAGGGPLDGGAMVRQYIGMVGAPSRSGMIGVGSGQRVRGDKQAQTNARIAGQGMAAEAQLASRGEPMRRGVVPPGVDAVDPEAASLVKGAVGTNDAPVMMDDSVVPDELQQAANIEANRGRNKGVEEVGREISARGAELHGKIADQDAAQQAQDRKFWDGGRDVSYRTNAAGETEVDVAETPSYRERLAQADDHIRQLASREPDPRRWWTDERNGSSVARMASAILMEIGGGVVGNHGRGMKYINGMIDKDIKQQMALQQRELGAAGAAKASIGAEAGMHMKRQQMYWQARAQRTASVAAQLDAMAAQQRGTVAGAKLRMGAMQWRGETEKAIASQNKVVNSWTQRPDPRIAEIARMMMSMRAKDRKLRDMTPAQEKDMTDLMGSAHMSHRMMNLWQKAQSKGGLKGLLKMFVPNNNANNMLQNYVQMEAVRFARIINGGRPSTPDQIAARKAFADQWTASLSSKKDGLRRAAEMFRFFASHGRETMSDRRSVMTGYTPETYGVLSGAQKKLGAAVAYFDTITGGSDRAGQEFMSGLSAALKGGAPSAAAGGRPATDPPVH